MVKKKKMTLTENIGSWAILFGIIFAFIWFITGISDFLMNMWNNYPILVAISWTAGLIAIFFGAITTIAFIIYDSQK